MMRAYEEKHSFINYKIDDKYDRSLSKLPYSKFSEGPVFPEFLAVDFSSYESFRMFVNLYGIEGFSCFYPPLKNKLSRIIEAAKRGNSQFISRRYIHDIWQEIKDRAENEQLLMYTFLQRFVTDPPTFPRLKELEIDDLELIENVQQHLKFEVEINISTLISFAGITSRDSIKTGIGELSEEEYIYPSILARCYRELIHLIQDNIKIKRCKNCHRCFTTDKRNENYCDRIAPEKIDEHNRLWLEIRKAHREVLDKYEPDADEWDKILTKDQKKKLEDLSCKKVGPYNVWKQGLSEEKLAFVEEKKRRLARLYYLKSKRKEEYQKAKEDFDRWIKENQPAAKGRR